MFRKMMSVFMCEHICVILICERMILNLFQSLQILCWRRHLRRNIDIERGELVQCLRFSDAQILVINGLDNGLLSVWYQAIASADLSVI